MKNASLQVFPVRPVALGASALVGALMLTACGGGGGSGDVSPPQPTLVTMVEPDIPTPVRRRLKGAQSATLRFNVTPEGTVADLEVLEVSNPALRQPVVDAIRQWRYNPPGQVVAQKVQLQVLESTD